MSVPSSPGRSDFRAAFKECDIRGPYPEQVNEELAYRLGLAVAARAQPPQVVVAGDVRQSTPALKASLIAGLCEGGVVVFDCGLLPTPAYYFARRHLGVWAGVMVTASHSPPHYNGFKPILGPLPITPQELSDLRQMVEQGAPRAGGAGRLQPTQVRPHYVRWLLEQARSLLPRPLPLTVVVDCGNGSFSDLAPEVLTALGVSLVPLFCHPDGRFPNRSPDVAQPGALAALGRAVQEAGADVGLAFDGDGDRVAFVDERGQPVPSDVAVALLARDALQTHGPAPIVLDIKLSQAVEEVVRAAGGQPLRERSGHTFMKTRMILHRALLGGEASGHVFFRALEGGDDGLYAGLAMLGLLARAGQPLSALAATIPRYAITPDIRIPFAGDASALLERLAAHAATQAGLEFLDGVKAHYCDGWALARASVTEPALTLRFEGRDGPALQRIIKHFLAPAPELLEPALLAAQQL
jgi:phosphomannomutase/phosphoglucomutase